MRKFLTALISLVLIFLPLSAQSFPDMQKIYEKYPGAKINVISWDEYENIKSSYEKSEIIYLAENLDTNSSESEKKIKKPPRTRTSASTRVHLQDFNINGSNDAAVVFVIIGVVVVVALVVYAGEYLYEVVMTDKEQTYWVDNAFVYSSFYNDFSKNYGSMSGYKISSGFDNRNVKVGVSAEVGSFDFRFGAADSNEWLGTGGSYFMAGPTVRFYAPSDRSLYLFMEMLGGKSDDKKISTMGHARVGFSKTLLNDLIFGVSFGALFVGLNDDEGILEYSDQFETTTCFEMGYRF